MVRIFLLLSILFFLITACGSERSITGENYGDILSGTSGAVLTEGEHPDGWGEADCLLCHSLENIHQVDRSGTGLNLEAIRRLTEEDGVASCSACHGSNGVE